MISKKEYRHNFFIFQTFSKLCILPLEFDGGSASILVSERKQKTALALVSIIILHSCFVIFRYFQTVLFADSVVRHHLLFHVDYSLASVMILGWYFKFFIWRPDITVALFNEFFSNQSSPVTRKVADYSRQEYLAIYMPYMIIAGVSFVLWTFSYDPTMKHLIYSALPAFIQTPFSFYAIYIEEMFFLWFLAATAMFVFSFQVMFFEKIIGDLRILRRASLGETYSQMAAGGEYMKLRRIQLLVAYFNKLNCFVTFSFKLFCITMCTLNGYFMIAYFSADPIFGTVYCIIFGVLVILYSILYEKAFAVPKMLRLTRAALLVQTTGGCVSGGFRKCMRRRLESIPAIGIQVGHFHTFERVATPVFIDYVVRNVVGLLLMHHK